MWSAGCTRSNVWIAEGLLDGSRIKVERLERLQRLKLTGHPFAALSKLLNGMTGAFVGIDAPFSLPCKFLPEGPIAAWRKLLTVDPAGRPFPTGKQLVATFAPDLAPTGKKVLRATEKDWRERGMNVRSTVWNGPRGGAPFAAACMTLLARHEGPVWSLKSGGDGATLAEAFPAAQLNKWGLPFQSYNGSKKEALANRRTILEGLAYRELSIAPNLADECLLSADALDAVICMFGAAAASSGRTVPMADNSMRHIEGMIAVHV